ncbi:uncharacterized protein RNJ42_00098 [Nakaseomyces bracarensis]|uniref:uncharacterized protein n=1 Tax=Nakaseomyces bracarensis TaxID=273131 RepID=UPI003871F50C
MIGCNLLVILSLLCSVLALPYTPGFWTDEVNFVSNSYITSDPNGKDFYNLALQGDVRTVTFNKDLSVSNFSVKAYEPNQGLSVAFTGPSSTISVPNGLFEIDNSMSPSQLQVNIIGSVFSASSISIKAAPNTDSTMYLDPINLAVTGTVSLQNIKYATLGKDTSTAGQDYDLVNSTLYMENGQRAPPKGSSGSDYYLSNSELWFDGGIQQTLNGNSYSLNYGSTQYGKNVFVIDPDQGNSNNIQLRNFGGSTDNYFASIYPIKSISIVLGKLQLNFGSSHFSFSVTLPDGFSSVEDFVLGTLVLDRNGTLTTVYTIRPGLQYIPVDPSTTIVDKGSTTETDIISYFPTIGTDSRTRTGSTTYTLVDTDTYSQPPETTATVDKGSTTETDVISYFPTVGTDGKTHTGTTTYTLVDTDTYSQPPETTATVDKGSTTETDVISYFPTVGTDGKTHTGTTTYTLVDTDTYSQPPETTATVDKGSTTETDVISYFPTVGTDGKTHTGTTTYTLVDTDTYSQPPETTATVDKGSTTETDVISYFPTVGTDGKTHTGTTTYTLVDTDTYSQPPETTATVDKGSTTETDVISYFPTVGTDGKTHTGTTTYTLVDTDTYSQPPETTATVDKGSTTETDVISYFPTVGTDGKTHTGTTTYTLVDTDTYSQPPETTATVDKGSTTETDVISYFPTVGTDGKTHTGTTTYTLVDTDTYSQPPETTATVDKGSTTETDVISYFPTVGTDGKTHTGTTTYTLGDHSSSKAGVTPLPIVTILETDIVSDGNTIHEIVLGSGYTESDGQIATSTWTELTMDMVDSNPLFLSPSEMASANESSSTDVESYSQPPATTATVDKGSTTVTEGISYFPTVGTDGKTHTGTTTYTLVDNNSDNNTDTYSQPPATTATVDKGSTTVTEGISYFPTVGTDGKTHTGTTTYTLVDNNSDNNTDTYSQPPATTATVDKGSTTVTEGISYFPTVGTDGKTHTGTTTYTLVDNNSDNNTDTYSQPPATTATVDKGSTTVTEGISYFPTVGTDGKTQTGSSTYTLSNDVLPTSGMNSNSNTGSNAGSSGSGSSGSGSNSGSNSGSGSSGSSGSGSSGSNSGSDASGSNSGTNSGSNSGANAGTNAGSAGSAGSGSGSNSGSSGSNAGSGSNSGSNASSSGSGSFGSGSNSGSNSGSGSSGSSGSGSSGSGSSGSNSGSNTGSNSGSSGSGSNGGSNVASGTIQGTHSVGQQTATSATPSHATVNSIQYHAAGSVTVHNLWLLAVMMLLSVI